VLVEIDGTRFGAIAREVAAGEQLAPGLVLGPELQQRLLAAADAEGAFRTMLRALERRAYARADLARRLIRKGHPRPAVEAAIERAVATGLVDDQAFTLDYVQTRAARGRGPSRLVRDLLGMGVERSLIDRAVAAQLPHGAAEDVVLALATKRAHQLAGLPRPVRRRRLLAFLARRGFGGAEALDLVRRLTDRSPAA
jgi:regulatory protein